MRFSSRQITSAAAMMSVFASLNAYSDAVYHVGNSLTDDSKAVERIAGREGTGTWQDHGHHLRWNTSLEHIVADPNLTGGGSFDVSHGKFNTALAGATWDAVTLQSFTKTVYGTSQQQPLPNGDGATIGNEATAALGLISTTQSNTANSGTKFYMYQPWAPRGAILADWNNTAVDDDTTPMGVSKAHHNLVYSRVKAGTAADVSIIPTGEVFYRLALALNNGDLASEGYGSSSDPNSYELLYRDDLHASHGSQWDNTLQQNVVDGSNGLGRYAAAATMYAAIYGDDLSSVDGVDAAHGSLLSAATTSFVNGIILQVLADDSIMNPVPEPTTGLLVLGAMGGMLLRRRRSA